ncbi:MAG: dTMP kinase [Saprospiraceae bacterium]
MPRGKLIVFEGIDGSGKSTQIHLLARYFESLGYQVHVTAEPTNNRIGKTIRDIFSGNLEGDQHVIAALFAADRLDHILNSVYGMKGLVENGVIVLCDRYYLSSLAYHSVHVSMDWVQALNVKAMETLKPDVHIYINISPEESIQRISSRNIATEMYENIENLKSVSKAYNQIIDMYQHTETIISIDGQKDVESIHQDIINKLKIVINGNH